jgi:hypothetical protein
VRTFWIISAVLGVFAFLMPLLFGLNLLIGLGAAVIFGPACRAGWWASWARRRMKKFSEDFANAVDVIVRGIKSGLPVHDCFKIIARESPAPLGPEFQTLVEGMGVGLTLPQALEKMYERMPTPELRFFAIVISIQQKTGGNLAEALVQPLQGAARPQDDEREDQGPVDGSQGLGRHHRLAAARGDDPRQPDHPGLHGQTVHRSARAVDAPGRVGVDGPRHLRDEEDDLVQVLGPGMGQVAASSPTPEPADPRRRRAGLRHHVHPAGVVRRRTRKLDSRMKAVAVRREELKRRSRQAMATGPGGLRHSDDRLQETGRRAAEPDQDCWKTPRSPTSWPRPAIRGPQALSTFYFFRFAMPFIFLAVSVFYLFVFNDFGLHS